MDSTCIVSCDRQLSSCAKSSGKLLLLRICPNNSRPSMLDQSQKMGFVSRQIIENLVFSTYNLTIPGANPNWSNDLLLHLWETKLATEIGANFNCIKWCSNTCLVFDLDLFKDHYRVCPYRIILTLKNQVNCETPFTLQLHLDYAWPVGNLWSSSLPRSLNLHKALHHWPNNPWTRGKNIRFEGRDWCYFHPSCRITRIPI